MLGIVVLAGGEGRRVGGKDKGWCEYQNQPYIEIVLKQLEQQVKEAKLSVQIVISANRNIEHYQSFGYPVIQDLRGGKDNYQGPLAGIESALDYGVKNNITNWISWPVDSLKLPADYVQSMQQKQQENKVLVADINQRLHYGHLSFDSTQLLSLQTYLQSGQRAIKHWLAQQTLEEIEFENTSPALLNCNY